MDFMTNSKSKMTCSSMKSEMKKIKQMVSYMMVKMMMTKVSKMESWLSMMNSTMTYFKEGLQTGKLNT